MDVFLQGFLFDQRMLFPFLHEYKSALEYKCSQKCVASACHSGGWTENSGPTAHERSMSTFFASVSHIYIFLTKVVSHMIITMDGNENVLQLICFWDDCCDCFWWWCWWWRRFYFLSGSYMPSRISRIFVFNSYIFHMILLLSDEDACVQCSSRFSIWKFRWKMTMNGQS